MRSKEVLISSERSAKVNLSRFFAGVLFHGHRRKYGNDEVGGPQMILQTTLNRLHGAVKRLSQGALSLVCALSLAFAATNTYAAETITYYHLDAQGSPVAATDEAGNVTWREDYRPYGDKLRNEAAPQSNTRWYTGHPHDPDTGLTYMGARWYDPVVGRFMGVDSKEFDENEPDTFNRYSYVGNNPYTYIDPDGQVKVKVGGGGSGLGGGSYYERYGGINIGTAGGLVPKSGPGATGVNALPKATGLVTKSGVKFGQASVKSTFAHGSFKGRTIGDVAQGLRSGKISPDQLPVEFVVRNGERIALNNRSLAALRRAGMQPTKLIDRTGSRVHERLLDRHLGGGQPSDFIRIRGGPPGSSLIE